MFFDTQLGAQERANDFDNQMRRYYQQQRQLQENHHASAGPLSTNEERLAGLIEDHCVDTMTLRQAHDSSRRRIVELESELAEMRAKKQAEAYVWGGSSNPFGSPVAVKSLTGYAGEPHMEENRRHERQAALAIAEHDAVLIRKLEGELVALRSQHETDVRLVKECAERVDSLLRENEEKAMRVSLSDAAAQRLQAQIHTLTDRLRTAELLLQHEKSSNLSRMDSLRRDDDAVLRLMDADSAAAASFEKYLTGPNESESMARVRAENARLRAALAHESKRLREQEDAFTRVKLSAEEITVVEAQEIARLERELDKCLDDKEHWQKRAKSAEFDLLQLQQRYQELLRDKDTEGGTRSGNSSSSSSGGGSNSTPTRTSRPAASAGDMMSPVPTNEESVYLRRVAAAGLMSPAVPLADDAYSGVSNPPTYPRPPPAAAPDRRGEREQKMNDMMERMHELEARLRGPAVDERYTR